MDAQVSTSVNTSAPKIRQAQPRPGYVMLTIIKNIVIKQNTELLKQIAFMNDLDEAELIAKYIKPEYYLPSVDYQ